MNKTTVIYRDKTFLPTEIPHDRHTQGGIEINSKRFVAPTEGEIY